MTVPTYDRAILGAGPAGLIAALQSAKTASTLLITRGARQDAYTRGGSPRVESVPAALLNLLIDFSIDPGRIGADRLHETRYSAWETFRYSASNGRATAHVDLTQLTVELMALVRRHPDLTVETETCLPVCRSGVWYGRAWRARTLLDASGRAMAMSMHRVHPRKPWVARPFWRTIPAGAGVQVHCDQAFRIAALPFGYAYRLACASSDMLWVVGRGECLRQSPDCLEHILKSSEAGWLLEGFAPLASAKTGRSYLASVQWPQDSACGCIGDAALSRDILSSQGLASGISDALYAVAVRNREDHARWMKRQAAARAAHLESLQRVFSLCRHRRQAEWRSYAGFVNTHQGAAVSTERSALISGHIRRVRSVRSPSERNPSPQA